LNRFVDLHDRQVGVADLRRYDGDDDDLSFLLLRYEDCLHTRGKFLLPVVAERILLDYCQLAS